MTTSNSNSLSCIAAISVKEGDVCLETRYQFPFSYALGGSAERDVENLLSRVYHFACYPTVEIVVFWAYTV